MESKESLIMKTFKEIYAYREMIFSLVRRDLKGRYKGSVLGFLWTFINPLLQLMVYTFVFSTVMRSGIEDYYLFLFVALVPWLFFSTSLTGGASSILAQKEMVKKIYFPREILPIAYTTSQFVNMLLSFIVIFIILLISGKGLNTEALLYLPIIMFIEYILSLGVAMLSSAVTVYFKDFEYILGILAMAWQFLSPVMYAVDMVPEEVMPIFKMNPMTPILIAYRDILYYKKSPDLSTLIQAIIFGVILLIVGWLIFGKLKRHFVEEM